MSSSPRSPAARQRSTTPSAGSPRSTNGSPRAYLRSSTPSGSFRERSATPADVDVPADVAALRGMSAMERIQQVEWANKMNKFYNDNGRRVQHLTAGKSPQTVRRESIERDQKESLNADVSVRQAARSRIPTRQSPFSSWATSREERFTYQYGAFENTIPACVPSKAMQARAPGVGSYGKSTSIP